MCTLLSSLAVSGDDRPPPSARNRLCPGLIMVIVEIIISVIIIISSIIIIVMTLAFFSVSVAEIMSLTSFVLGKSSQLL